MASATFKPQENINLAALTTIGLGGPARYYSVCQNEDDIRSALAFAAKENLPLMVVGGGSNLVFSDRGFNGVVISPRLTALTPGSPGEITAGAGLAWDKFVQTTLGIGLGGLETLSGIPGLVGAVPVQNVGAYGAEVSEFITQVTAINRQSGQISTFLNRECDFSYRSSRFKTRDHGRYVITGVTFQLYPPDYTSPLKYPPLRDALAETLPLPPGPAGWRLVREKVLALRRSKSMVVDPSDPNTRSCGSFFVNPLFTPRDFSHFQKAVKKIELPAPPSFPSHGKIKVPAAWIIERAGFPRGYRQGGVGVSPKHNLVLVNNGGTTEDLLRLARSIQAAVKKKFSLDLEIEPEIIP